MTIICPRCAVRFSVTVPMAATVTPSCPACGTRVPRSSDGGAGAKPADAGKSESPSGLWRSNRSASAEAPRLPTTEPELVAGRPPGELDLPQPKRPLAESAGPGAGVGASLMLQRPRLRAEPTPTPGLAIPATANLLNPEVLRDLPTPLGPVKDVARPLGEGAEARWERKRAEETAQGIPPVVPTTLRTTRPRSQPILEALPVAPPPAGEPLRIPVTRPELSLPPPPRGVPVPDARDENLAVPRRHSRPELAALAASPPTPATPLAAPPRSEPGVAAPGPSDRTAPEPAETMEQRMHLAPAKKSLEPVAMPATAPLRSDAGETEPLRRMAPTTQSPPRSGDSPAAPTPAAETAKVPSDGSQQSTSGSPQAELAPGSSDEQRAAAETGEQSPEPPHLPLGWIIGALFVLALTLTLWIAHRAGVFSSSPPSLPPYGQPTSAAPPRMY